MASRPLYMPSTSPPYVKERPVEFKWHAGFSVSQKQKSIDELHSASIALDSSLKPLEVSSKSTIEVGIALSAFNLSVQLNSGLKVALENIFQSSKVFMNGGPFRDLLTVTPLEAKRDIRLKESGDLIAFESKEIRWPTEPRTLFYDWIYIKALQQNSHLIDELTNYNGFTDIEFNPKKSFNCQARSVAVYAGLKQAGLLEQALSSSEKYKKIVITMPNCGNNRLDQ